LTTDDETEHFTKGPPTGGAAFSEVTAHDVALLRLEQLCRQISQSPGNAAS
jgi:hypothetical protein